MSNFHINPEWHTFDSVVKKLTIGFLATIYIIVAVGVTISAHFCGGYLESYSINTTTGEHNCCGGMPMDDNCCENKQIIIKSSEDHFAADFIKIERPAFISALPVFQMEYLAIVPPDVAATPLLHLPPLLSRCPVHIKNRILII